MNPPNIEQLREERAALIASRVIPVYVRNVYGALRVYAADPVQARHLSALTGKETLSVTHAEALRALGFTLQETRDPENKTLASDLFALGVSAMRSQANPQA